MHINECCKYSYYRRKYKIECLDENNVQQLVAVRCQLRIKYMKIQATHVSEIYL